MIKWRHLKKKNNNKKKKNKNKKNRKNKDPPRKKKKAAKRGPRGLWKQDLVDDLVDIIITNDYYQRKLSFVNTKNQQKGKVYEKVLNEFKSRAEGKGSSFPFTVSRVRAKFKTCISECKKAALTIKTATGVKRFLNDKNYGVWFDRLFELVKTRDSCRPDLATEPLMNVPVTDCNDDVDSENQDLDKDHPSTQLFVPGNTAPKKRKRKGDNTEILTEAVNLLKTAVENGASKDMLVFLKEYIEISRKHELKLFKLLCTQDGLPQPSSYPREPSYNPNICPTSSSPSQLVLCQDMPECMVESPQEDHSEPQAPPQLLKMQAVLMRAPLIVIFKLLVLNAVHIRQLTIDVETTQSKNYHFDNYFFLLLKQE